MFACLVGYSLLTGPVAFSSAFKDKELKFSGYITEVYSPTSFLVDDYRVTVEDTKVIELENVESSVIKFDPVEQIKVGTFIKYKGRYDTETLQTVPTEIKIDMKQFRKLAHSVVLDSHPVDLIKDTDGFWTGFILADARRILVSRSTKVRFKLNKSEEKEAKQKAEQAKKQSDAKKKNSDTIDPNTHLETTGESDAIDQGFDDDGDMIDLLKGSKPLRSLDDIEPGVYMTYRGKEDAFGSLIADQIVFVRNEKTKDEIKMWKDLRLRTEDPKKSNSFSKLVVGKTSYKLIPEAELQDYISRLGEALIPEYQKTLPDGDENKIPFKFVLIHDEGFNAGAYATGTVVVNHDVLNYLENEAQLVFLLSHEIAHATQEHTIRQQNNKKVARQALRIGGIFADAMGYEGIRNILWLSEAAMKNGYARSLENQADRMGLANMIASGYDPREAPRTWKVAALNFGDQQTNFFWSSHDSNTERRSFLWLTIHNTYPDLDYTTMRTDSNEFRQAASLVETKYPAKQKRIIASRTPSPETIKNPPPEIAKFFEVPTPSPMPTIKPPDVAGTEVVSAVTFRSNPDGADIEIDGKFAGSTPSMLQLKAGDYKIAIKSSGFSPWERTISVISNGTISVNATLQRIPVESTRPVSLPQPVARPTPSPQNQVVSVNASIAKSTTNGTVISSNPEASNQSRVPTVIAEPGTRSSASGIQLVWIPAGSFQMGSTDGEKYERPVRRVVISEGFWMGKYEVTQLQWFTEMGVNPSDFEKCGGACPVENVSWEDAQRFVARLNAKNDGFVYSLPTEAQWEYAARAGTTGKWAGDLKEMAWYSDNSNGRTQPVGTKRANAFGLHDMHGNVWEWCEDWYGDYPKIPETDPRGPAKGKYRILRGGSWKDGSGDARSAYRGGLSPSTKYDEV
jgi:formylglycine-generating enzyme required for sulfatase activity